MAEDQRQRIAQARRQAAEEGLREIRRDRHRKLLAGGTDIVATTLLCTVLIAGGLHYDHVRVPVLGTWAVTCGVFFVIVTAVRYGTARALRERDRD